MLFEGGYPGVVVFHIMRVVVGVSTKLNGGRHSETTETMPAVRCHCLEPNLIFVSNRSDFLEHWPDVLS